MEVRWHLATVNTRSSLKPQSISLKRQTGGGGVCGGGGNDSSIKLAPFPSTVGHGPTCIPVTLHEFSLSRLLWKRTALAVVMLLETLRDREDAATGNELDKQLEREHCRF